LRAELVIIGAGFWGSAIALELQAQGQSMLLIDGELAGSASRVAAGLVRESSLVKPLAPWWNAAHTEACRGFLERWGQRGDEFLVSQQNATAGPGRIRPGLWQLRPQDILQPALPWHVERLQPTQGRWLVHCRQEVISAAQVILAAGIHCDRILRRSGLEPAGLQPQPGAALVGSTTHPLEMPRTRGYRLPADTRTRTVTARNWGAGQLRVGDTCGPSQTAQLTMLHHWFAAAGGQRVPQPLWGIRPRYRQGILVQPWRPGLILASGGGRTGLAIAAGVALRVHQLLSL